jgi:hypothetical protein
VTDGHQSVPPILLTTGRLEIISALGVNAVDDPSHGLLVILRQVDAPLT